MKPNIHEESTKWAMIKFLRLFPVSRTISVIVRLNDDYGNNFKERGSLNDLHKQLLRDADQLELFNAIKETFKRKFDFAKPEPFSLSSFLNNVESKNDSEE